MRPAGTFRERAPEKYRTADTAIRTGASLIPQRHPLLGIANDLPARLRKPIVLAEPWNERVDTGVMLVPETPTSKITLCRTAKTRSGLPGKRLRGRGGIDN
jgi:hypothetical protein